MPSNLFSWNWLTTISQQPAPINRWLYHKALNGEDSIARSPIFRLLRAFKQWREQQHYCILSTQWNDIWIVLSTIQSSRRSEPTAWQPSRYFMRPQSMLELPHQVESQFSIGQWSLLGITICDRYCLYSLEGRRAIYFLNSSDTAAKLSGTRAKSSRVTDPHLRPW